MENENTEELSISTKRQVKTTQLISPSDFMLLFLTCLAAPLISHLCDLTIGVDENPLTSEKLLCTYFVLIAVYIINENIISLLNKTGLWDKGLRLGNSDSFISTLYFVGATMVIAYYDTLPGILVIIGIFIVLFVLLLFCPNNIKLNSRKMILIAFIAAIVVPAALYQLSNENIYSSPQALTWLLTVQLIVCLLFDGAFFLAKGIKRRIEKG